MALILWYYIPYHSPKGSSPRLLPVQAGTWGLTRLRLALEPASRRSGEKRKFWTAAFAGMTTKVSPLPGERRVVSFGWSVPYFLFSEDNRMDSRLWGRNIPGSWQKRMFLDWSEAKDVWGCV